MSQIISTGQSDVSGDIYLRGENRKDEYCAKNSNSKRVFEASLKVYFTWS